MGQKEENKRLIEQIEIEINALRIPETEDGISGDVPYDESIDLLICKKTNLLSVLYEEIHSINENLIVNNYTLYSRMGNVLSMINAPVGIEFLDNNSCSNYFARKFYREINEKYKGNFGKILELGFISTQYGRVFKSGALEDPKDIEKALKIDQHIKLCHISTVLKILSNTLKCINYNYLN